jgi:hypothetical protein
MNYTSSEKPDHSRISFYRREYSNQVNNIGVYRRTSGSTFSSGITDSTETLLHKKERSNDEMFGVSQKSPLDWSIEEVITWLESVGLENVICNFIGMSLCNNVVILDA